MNSGFFPFTDGLYSYTMFILQPMTIHARSRVLQNVHFVLQTTYYKFTNGSEFVLFLDIWQPTVTTRHFISTCTSHLLVLSIIFNLHMLKQVCSLYLSWHELPFNYVWSCFRYATFVTPLFVAASPLVASCRHCKPLHVTQKDGGNAQNDANSACVGWWRRDRESANWLKSRLCNVAFQSRAWGRIHIWHQRF
jgi:hypothetical protein